MTLQRQRVGAGQPGRPGTHDRDLAAGGRGAGEELGLGTFHERIDRMALQPADGDGLALLRGAHAGLLAQGLGRADAGAHAAQRVGFENGAGRTAQVAVGYPSNKGGHVDAGRAGGDAGRIKAVEAAFGFKQRLGCSQARTGIGKVQGVLASIKTAWTDVGKRGNGHVQLLHWVFAFKADCLVKF